MRWLRRVRRPGKCALTVLLTLLFLAVSSLPRFTPRAEAANQAAPPLPVPEDPLGQQPEQQAPETAVSVDTRDGHVTARVVDIWGPGRTPFIVRSLTNGEFTTVGGAGTGVAPWQFNHLLDTVGLTDAGLYKIAVREPDGNRTRYKYLTREGSGTEQWDVYVDDIGTYTTLKIHFVNCFWDPGTPARRAASTPTPRRAADTTLGWVCDWDGTYTVYLPKGLTRKFRKNPAPNETGLLPERMPTLIEEERDANGNVTTFTWTTFADQIRAYIASVRDPVGRMTTYTYERSHQECVNDPCTQMRWHYRVRQITDPWGRTATYTYDANRRLTSVVNGAGFTTSYAYGVNGLTGLTNARGHATSVQWTTLAGYGRVTRVTAPDGSATTYTYTFTGSRPRRTVVTNARGHTTTYDFYLGDDERYIGNLEQVIDALGNVTQYTYDDRHNVTQQRDARSNRTTYQYNSRNKVTQVVRAAGTLNLTTTATWDANDNQLTLTNARGIVTQYTYDTKHNLTHVKKAAGIPQDESTTQYVYNAWGGVTQVIDPRGYITSYTYTARRQVQTITPPVGGPISFTYDAFDDQRTKVDGNGRTWSTDYNAQRLVTREADPLNYAVTHAYDQNGNRTSTTDAKGKTTTFTYDNRDRLIRITDPYTRQTQYQYDAVGNLTRVTNARTFATVFDYDVVNRLSRVTDALGKFTTYQYDAVGNRTQMVDRKNQTHAYTYDQANRLTQASAGGQTITYTYSLTSQRLTMVDPIGTTTYGYDSLDRLTSTQYPDSKTVTATYDRAGNRVTLTNPGGVTTQAQYDGANRLTQLTQGTLTWAFTYDAAGNRTRLTHPNGTSTDYAYLGNTWLSSITDKTPGGVAFQTTSYSYDQNGNRTSQTDSSGQATFGYDDLNRLTSAAYPGGYGTWGWTYDEVGNRLTQTGPSGTTTYTYDGNNRLLQAVAGTTVTYGYDDNGNLLTISTGRSFTWDVFNRMTQATGPGGTVTHTYNGDGLKTRRVGPDGTRRYFYDGIRPIWETDDAGVMTAQYDRDIFGNLLSRREASGARRYYHFDGLGSTTALTNETGGVTSTLLYDAWGNQRAATGSDQGRYRFTGAELDQATGLYHMGARFYDPTIGRWLSEDPVQSFKPATLNFYAYVAANPVVFVDAAGTCDQACLQALNEQRQKAAMVAIALELLTGISAVATYSGYLGQSRSDGHIAAMGELVDRLRAAMPSEQADDEGLVAGPAIGPARPSTSVSPDTVLGFYDSASRLGQAAFFGGIALGALGPVGLTVGGSLYAGARMQAATATRLDTAYYGGRIWGMVDPRRQAWFDLLGLPHP
ncbi:MAG: RHS repeat-associated core domain-containing protein [Armatimonadota bacterium]|nr:RHS repeat-associated core domain-containing protein [Armatimonadota bacterium]